MSRSNTIVRKLQALLLSVAVSAGATAWAGEIEEAIAARLSESLPALGQVVVEPTPAPGLYKVVSEQNELIYTTEDGQFLISGELLQLTDDGLVSLSENARAEIRVAAMNKLGQEGLIRFPAEGEQKAQINVFTDIDCGYCRKLHTEVPQLNAMGITVNYYAFPRSGPNTASFAKYESVWCADDQRAAMNAAKRGERVAAASCENPVLAQYQLGRQLGVTGTPAIVLEDGNMIRGYVPAEQLAKGLGVR
ncbi:MAG: DsbC family protein [Marinobacter sp.]|uniref:DsbC family protein n=1 Tax=Marinobacter sp. TaxID=50741 RepID=UPI00299E2DD4|nr:DsbC family protein [Marinobacter sp.]MDX1754460.1 DsbC family protein [Marinobacter sp.]